MKLYIYETYGIEPWEIRFFRKKYDFFSMKLIGEMEIDDKNLYSTGCTETDCRKRHIPLGGGAKRKGVPTGS